MPSLAARFEQHVRATALLAPDQPVLVALSGGLDSVVLLHLLRFALPHPVHAAHFDHAMRADSAADAAWVRGLCLAWRVPLHTARAALPPRSEADARAARYAFLHEAARAAGVRRIATAHHRDDQLETVLFRLARGTGLRGLAGIPAVRGDVIRPLLPFPRRDLLAYARAHRLRWREDPSNAGLAYARNRIRHGLLPAVFAAGLDRRLEALAAIARGVEQWWRQEMRELLREADLQPLTDGWSLARGGLRDYHPATRARVMRYLLRRLGVVPDRRATRSAARFIDTAASGARLSLGGGTRIEREFERILLRRPADPGTGTADRPIVIGSPDAGAGYALIGGVRYLVRWGMTQDAARGPDRSAFDAAALRFPLELRGWRPGDRIYLGFGTKKLKKLFAEKRVGAGQRARVPVLAEQRADGRVLWVKDVAHADLPRGPWQITVEHEESG